MEKKFMVRSAIALLAITAVIAAALPSLGAPQNPDDLLPAESAAKAMAILQQAIGGLGGSAYLGVRDSDCSARFGNFDSATGASGASIEIHILRLFPDKTRTEFHGDNYITDLPLPGVELHGRSVVITVYTADQAWTFDKGGVSDLPADSLMQYGVQLKTDLNNILRTRLNEAGMIFRYAGTDVVDLKQVDWIEVTDPERHTVRMAIEREKHLPVRSVALSRDTLTRLQIEDATEYANFHPIDGVQTPFRITRERNGRVLSQTSYESCHYNTGISPSLFTREGLEASRTSRKAKR